MSKKINLVYSGTIELTLKAGEFTVIEASPAEPIPPEQPCWFSEIKAHMENGLVASPQSHVIYPGTMLVRLTNIHKTPKIIDALVGNLESKEIRIQPGDPIGVVNFYSTGKIEECSEKSESE